VIRTYLKTSSSEVVSVLNHLLNLDFLVVADVGTGEEAIKLFATPWPDDALTVELHWQPHLPM